MKLLYDNIIFDLQNAGGISVYWYELTKRLLKSSYTYSFLESYNWNNMFREQLNIPNHKIVREKNIPINIRRYIDISKSIKNYDICHSSYYRISTSKNIKNIVTVHDFTYEYFMKGVPKFIHHTQKKHAIKNADGIICVSENTKKDLLSFFPRIKEEKISVIYNGVNEEFHIIKNKNNSKFSKYKDKKYILFVGDRSSYKNFDIILEVLCNLDEYILLIIGGGNLTYSEKFNLNTKLGRERYDHIQNVSVEELNIIYNFAHCLIYPSSYEGFGIPVIEAMKAGCPVIAMNKSAIPEISGGAAVLFDDLNVDKIIQAIKFLEIKFNRKEVIKKGFLHASKFSWDKTFDETINFYMNVVSRKI